MLNFRIVTDDKTGDKHLETELSGKPLLTTPQLNKGTAFTEQERHDFNLIGKLPSHIEKLEDQTQRVYEQYKIYKNPLNKNIFLNRLHNTNQLLFYKLVSEHLEEMIPIVYTPVVGAAVIHYSRDFRNPRGLYISYNDIDSIEEILNNRSHPEIDLIVTSDGEGVLGIGDQGVGAMRIPVAKLMVYTLCGGINPLRTLPIFLDLGTNNESLLDDPLYLGWRHKRITGKDYDKFIDAFVSAIKKLFPDIYLHWEDFGRVNARNNLDRFRKKICSFNDDIQGTGVVTLAALLAALKANKSSLKDQRIVVFGAGSAGTGISEQIYAAMIHEGLTEEEARSRFWMINSKGLLLSDNEKLLEAQKIFARPPSDIANWDSKADDKIDLLTVVKHVKPTVLIGCSAVTGAFTKEVIQQMMHHVGRPIILPLSNPTERSEATPSDILNWTNGKAFIATGSPFDPVDFQGHKIHIAQCNNALAFPGIGLGVLAIKATEVSNQMLSAACDTLSNAAPIHSNPKAALLPSLTDAKDVARKIAIAVAKQAQKEGLATINDEQSVEDLIDAISWEPKYLPYTRSK